ncbi:SafA/ExsA family spore coat assembly protein [Bacillus sp. FJAT-52991]|uniref:SafA/ExsA family spore coat assembly protein n=1 Tax=Bacillus kandeliae TaxID=3129297 RepID=A0ABZ2N453_9BACI
MKIHIVQKGDTLWTIAKKYGVNFEELKKMNAQLSNPDLIMPGMKIKVPTPAGMTNKEMPKSGTVEKEKKVEQPIAPITKEKKIEQLIAPVKEVKPPPPPVKEKEKVVIPKPSIMPPPMPPIIPEVEINQIFQMHHPQQAPPAVLPAAQPPPKVPKVPKKPDNIFPGLSKKEEVESPEAPMTPAIMPEMVAVPQLQGGCFQPMNPYMPMYHMSPQSCGCEMAMPVQPMTMPIQHPNVNMPMAMPIQQPNVNMPMAMPIQQPNVNMPMAMPIQQPNVNMPMTMPIQQPNVNMPMTMPIQHPNVHMAMMEESSDESAMMPNVQGVQAMESPMQGYPTQAFPAAMPGTGCVPVTPVMPGTGFCSPFGMAPTYPVAGAGYGMEYPGHMPTSVMGAYTQPPAYGAHPNAPYMHGQYPTHPMYPMDCGCGHPEPYGMPRFDEEDEQ